MKILLKYIQGDITDLHSELDNIKIIPHVCNDIKAFGAGVSGAIGRRWPSARDAYYTSDNSTRLGEIVVKQSEPNIYIVHMIAQHGIRSHNMEMIESIDKNRTRPPIRYGALASCMRKVTVLSDYVSSESKDISIYCPMFGAGLAGGDWNVIEEMILEIWVDHGLPVNVVYL